MKTINITVDIKIEVPSNFWKMKHPMEFLEEQVTQVAVRQLHAQMKEWPIIKETADIMKVDL